MLIKPCVEVGGRVNGHRWLFRIEADLAHNGNGNAVVRYWIYERRVSGEFHRLSDTDIFGELLAISLAHHHKVAPINSPLGEDAANSAGKGTDAGAVTHHFASEESSKWNEEDESDEVIESGVKELLSEDNAVANQGHIAFGKTEECGESKEPQAQCPGHHVHSFYVVAVTVMLLGPLRFD